MSLVPTTVSLVSVPQKIVSTVKNQESTQMSVTVQTDSMTTKPKLLNVIHVTTDVKPVTTKITIVNTVPLTELTPQNVTVKMVWLKLMEYVSLVTQLIVSLVITMIQAIVGNVSPQKSMLQIVNAHQTCTNYKTEIVDNVISNVSPVSMKPTNVSPVEVTEISKPIVDAQPVFMKIGKNPVHLVDSDVLNVSLMNTIVPFVSKTESVPQPVTVLMVLITPMNHYVQHVEKNVPPVLINLITVLLVPET